MPLLLVWYCSSCRKPELTWNMWNNSNSWDGLLGGATCAFQRTGTEGVFFQLRNMSFKDTDNVIYI
jgi:hypothetical protein